MGLGLDRLAERACEKSKFHEPPLVTRKEPLSGPVGSTTKFPAGEAW